VYAAYGKSMNKKVRSNNTFDTDYPNASAFGSAPRVRGACGLA
jgi:hypothetical protein